MQEKISPNDRHTKFPGKMRGFAKLGKNLVFRHVTILNWLPKYNKTDAISDAVAGFTVGLTLVPQSIAYAALAGLTAQYGLYSAFMGGFVYAVFGTIREVSIGPTSLMALLCVEYTQGLPVEFMVLLAFLCGCVQFLIGVLHLGFLVDFISEPVRSGFTSAMAVYVSASQLKGLFGISYTSHGFPDNIRHLVMQAGEARLWDSVLGACCIVFLLSLRKIKDIPIGPKDSTLQTQTHRVIKKALWFISISRNALIVLLCTVVAHRFMQVGPSPFILSGKVAAGLPSFGLPPFSAQVGNRTYSFVEMCGELGSAIVVAPLVAVLANVAIAKAFSTGATLDATQEMLTLGLCNIFGSCVHSMPTCGAFTRSAVSNASGARTPLVGVYSGTIILLALSFLTPYFYYIPRATLSSVLICAVMFMFEYEAFLPLWRTSKYDFFLMVLTFLTCLGLGMEFGLLMGIAVNIMFLLYLWARPRVVVTTNKSLVNSEYVLVTLDIGLFYPAANFLHTEVTHAGLVEGMGRLPVVVDCSNFKGVDYTIAMGMNMMSKDFGKRKQRLIFTHVKEEILSILHNARVELQFCSTEDELMNLLICDKLDLLARPEAEPLLEKLPAEKTALEKLPAEKTAMDIEPSKRKNSLLRAVLSNSRTDIEKTGCDYVDELRRRGSFAE